MSPVLDLGLIKTFLTIVEAGEFKLAAKLLNKTPAAISMQIKKLEEILGERVMERSNQGILVTTAGEILLDKGQRLLLLNYELLGTIRDIALRGQLSFGSPADYTPTVLKQLIPVFQRDFPGVTPSIVLEPSRVLRQRVQSGALDMAIVATEPEEEEGFLLWSETVAWFGNTFTTAGVPRIGILSTDCVLRDRALRDLKCLPNGYEIILEATSVRSLREAAEAGFCQTFLPVSSATGLKRSELMVARDPLIQTFALITRSTLSPQITQRILEKLFNAPQAADPNRSPS